MTTLADETAEVEETSPPEPGFWAVTLAMGGRSLQRIVRKPSLILPTVIMPVFFLVAFTGSFSAVTAVPGYGTDKAVNWMTAWALLQGAAFAGVGAAGAVATDMENGFIDRLISAPINRLTLISGPITYAVGRALIPITAVLFVAVLYGVDFAGGLLGLLVTVLGGLGLAMVVGLFGLGVVFQFGTLRSLSLVQIGLFTFMFLSIGQAPIAAMEGWLAGVARVNPMTNIIRMTRQGFLGDVAWATTWPGLLALAGLAVLTGTFALIGLRRVAPWDSARSAAAS